MVLRHLGGKWILIHVTDAKLSDRAQLACDPGRQDLSTLLLAETRAWEVALRDEGHDVRHNLVFAKNSIDNNGDKGGQERFASNFEHNDNQATRLEDSTIEIMLVRNQPIDT